MRVLDANKVEKLFPIGSFFGQRGRAKACLDPVSSTIGSNARLLHVVQVFVPSDGATAEAAVRDRLQQGLFAAAFNARLYQITHGRTYTRSRRRAVTRSVGRRDKAEYHPARFLPSHSTRRNRRARRQSSRR